MKTALCTLALVALVTAGLNAQQPATTTQPTTKPADPGSGQRVTLTDGLTIVFIQKGEGARVGDTVWIHYEGRLENGTKFDSSYERNEAIPVTLGQGSVIRGWEEGILGMEVGEKRQLIIPPGLAYGAAGRGERIPPNSTLVFDIELVGLRRG